jgi:glycosyltransferase involved in cell wall biosynthesis
MNLEYMVIDDGSTDETKKLFSRFEFSRVVYHKQPNMGEAVAVNEGLKRASGKYFMIVNSDDPLYTRWTVSYLVEFMESNPGILLGYPNWISIDENEKERSWIEMGDYDFSTMVANHYCFPGSGSIYRREIIDTVGYRDSSFKYIADLDYFWRIGLEGGIKNIPITLATWMHRKGQISSKKSDEKALEHIKIVDKFYSLPFVPKGLIKRKREAYFWANLVATVVANWGSKLHYVSTATFCLPEFLVYPRTYKMLFRHAKYILRR